MNNYTNGTSQYQTQTQGLRLYKGQYYSESQLEPLSPWAYFGLSILFALPVIGFIFLIVFSVSNDNINRRNYARSFWCALIIALALSLVLFIIALVTGGLSTLVSQFQSGLAG